MSIKVTSLPDAEPRPRKVAIGTFDGVHRGHQALIATARRLAASNGGEVMALFADVKRTFDPAGIFNPGRLHGSL